LLNQNNYVERLNWLLEYQNFFAALLIIFKSLEKLFLLSNKIILIYIQQNLRFFNKIILYVFLLLNWKLSWCISQIFFLYKYKLSFVLRNEYLNFFFKARLLYETLRNT